MYSKEFRESLGLTQKELAEKLDLSISTIRQWDQKIKKPGYQSKKLLEKLKESMDNE